MPTPTQEQTAMTPTVKEGLDFPEAMRAVMLGRAVSKREWGNAEIYLVLRDGFLKLVKPEGIAQVLISEGDMVGKDWFIVK